MRRVLKWIFIVLIAIIVVPIVVMVILYSSADMGEPKLTIDPSSFHTRVVGDTLYCRQSYLLQDPHSKLWELYVVGSFQERGAVQGALTKELMRYQEDVFIDQIREIIPSDSYLSFLRNLIVIFNRNLGQYVPLEYREEILAMSQFCTDEYNAIGTPYERQLNYHGAHDIGHTMQQYMLVGCSSFGVWDTKSADGELLIARNFDFYVGDDFAKNKMITFAWPDRGYRYASIGWAGMLGVLSGMNQEGLTVTINAAKGTFPTSAALPISLLAREILQYAATIDEAYAIAKSHKTFVSESLLIGSLRDNRAALIEKTPEKIALFESPDNQIISTNHYQSEEFALDSYNIENIEFSDSKYRYDRASELLDSRPKVDYLAAADILRDRYGKGASDVGVGNEMTLNQSIAHHSVIFRPSDSKMWISTEPWQSGKIVCYNLQGFFEDGKHPTQDSALEIAADSIFMKEDYQRLLMYREGVEHIAGAINHEQEVSQEYLMRFETQNPNNYYTYRLLGDYWMANNQQMQAIEMYQRSLLCEIPYLSERLEIEELINKLE